MKHYVPSSREITTFGYMHSTAASAADLGRMLDTGRILEPYSQSVGLKRAVRYGEGWMGAGSSSSADFVKQAGEIGRLLDEAKREPATFAISKRVYLAIDDDRDRAERRLREWFALRYKNAETAARVSVWGSVNECIDKLGDLVRAGAKHVLLNPVFDEMEHLDLLAAEILPHL